MSKESTHFSNLLSRKPKSEWLLRELEFERCVDRLEVVINHIIEQTLICQGYILRQGIWQDVKRLNRPLSPEEKNHIRRIKRKAIPCELVSTPISNSTLMPLRSP
jgi:hypothetical protein